MEIQSGDTYYLLTFLKPFKRTLWRCRCECGRELYVSVRGGLVSARSCSVCLLDDYGSLGDEWFEWDFRREVVELPVWSGGVGLDVFRWSYGVWERLLESGLNVGSEFMGFRGMLGEVGFSPRVGDELLLDDYEAGYVAGNVYWGVRLGVSQRCVQRYGGGILGDLDSLLESLQI